MESQPKNHECRIIPENFILEDLKAMKRSSEPGIESHKISFIMFQPRLIILTYFVIFYRAQF